MARKRSKGSKRPIEAYQHTEHKRLNNPPAGLVTPETDPEGGKKTYRYDPHLDPELNFDSRKIRDELTEVIEQGLKAETLDQAKKPLRRSRKRRSRTSTGPARRSTPASRFPPFRCMCMSALSPAPSSRLCADAMESRLRNRRCSSWKRNHCDRRSSSTSTKKAGRTVSSPATPCW